MKVGCGHEKKAPVRMPGDGSFWSFLSVRSFLSILNILSNLSIQSILIILSSQNLPSFGGAGGRSIPSPPLFSPISPCTCVGS